MHGLLAIEQATHFHPHDLFPVSKTRAGYVKSTFLYALNKLIIFKTNTVRYIQNTYLQPNKKS